MVPALTGMTADELCAAIPTNEAWANDRMGWVMPNANLSAARRKQTRKILRSDDAKDGALCVTPNL